MITVIVVGPRRLLREGIRTLIDKEADIEVIGTAEDGEQALQQLKELQPNVVVMDADMPDYEAIKTCTKMKEINKEIRVVYLTDNKEVEIIFRAIANGVDGLLVKEVYPDMLGEAIRNAYRGQYVLSGDVAKIVVDQVRKITLDVEQILQRRLENKGIKLTKRELNIVGLIARGYSNSQISKELHLSEGTIKNYISEIYIKLGINHRKKVIEFLEDLLQL